MRKYRQLTSGERYALAALGKQGHSQAEIARSLGRHRSTISRELRNCRPGRRYNAGEACQQARGRRSRSRRNQRFTLADWAVVVSCLEEHWSPEQIAGRLKRKGELSISHETIYRYVWRLKKRGGALYRHLRRPVPRTAAESATGRPIPSLGRTSTAFSRWLNERSVWSSSPSSVPGPSQSSPGLPCPSSTTRPYLFGPSPLTTVPSSTATRTSRPLRAPSSSSLRLIIPGSVEPSRTPTASSDSTCRSAKAWLASPKPTAPGSPTGSTTGPANDSTTSPQRSVMTTHTALNPRCTSNLILSQPNRMRHSQPVYIGSRRTSGRLKTRWAISPTYFRWGAPESSTGGPSSGPGRLA